MEIHLPSSSLPRQHPQQQQQPVAQQQQMRVEDAVMLGASRRGGQPLTLAEELSSTHPAVPFCITLVNDEHPPEKLVADSRGEFARSVHAAPPDSAATLIEKAAGLFDYGDYAAALALYDAALAAAKELGSSELQRQACFGAGAACARLGDHRRAVEFHSRRLELCEAAGDREGAGAACNGLGIAYFALGEHEKAVEMHQRHLDAADESKDREAAGCALANLGEALRALGKLERASECFEQSLRAATEAGDAAGIGTAHGGLGDICEALGEHRKALDHFKKFLTVCEDYDDLEGEARATAALGRAYYALGDLRTAKDYHERQLEIASVLGDVLAQAQAFEALGDVYHRLGENAKAIEAHRKRLALAREASNKAVEGKTLEKLGEAYLGTGDFNKAVESLNGALDITKEEGDRAAQARILQRLGTAHGALQEDLAIPSLRMSLQITEDLLKHAAHPDSVSLLSLHSETSDLLAEILSSKGRHKEALSIVDNSRMQSLAESLPEDEGPLSEEEICNIAKASKVSFIVFKENPSKGVWAWVVPIGGGPGDISFERVVSYEGDKGALLYFQLRKLVFELRRGVVTEESLRELSDVAFGNESFARAIMRLAQRPERERTLVVVPQGLLWSVPFTALSLPGVSGRLLDCLSIMVAPSIRVFKALTKRCPSGPSSFAAFKKALVVGDPSPLPMAPGSREPEAPLPLSADEARRVAALVGGSPLLGVQAQKGDVLDRICDAQLVHMATHSNPVVFYRDDMSPCGAIALAASNAPDDDGWLRASEVQELKLRGSPLVVLSCFSSVVGGKPTEPKGADSMFGLARAFLAAGARGVFLSLWATDKGAGQFMDGLYANLVANGSCVDALGRAARQVRDQADDPALWAGFAFIGGYRA
eukprot:m51a1_g5216 hypothetical protein (885) ;mRNA; r:256544-259486